jgi:hypothetical protein
MAICAAVAPYSESSIEPSKLFRGALLFHQMTPDNLYINDADRLFLNRITHKSKFAIVPTLAPNAFVLLLSFPCCRVLFYKVLQGLNAD